MPVETHPEEGIHLREAELRQALTAGQYWRWSTWALLGITGILVLGCIYLGAQPKWKPYYVAIDTCDGSVRVVGAAPETVTLPQLAVNKTVGNFVRALRGISTDEMVTKDNWRALEHQVTLKGSHLLVQYQQQYDPLHRVDPVVVEQLQVFPRTPTTYYVRWTEQTFSGKSPKRERIGTAIYSGMFTFERREPRGPDERADAPLGLFFDAWTIEKEK